MGAKFSRQSGRRQTMIVNPEEGKKRRGSLKSMLGKDQRKLRWVWKKLNKKAKPKKEDYPSVFTPIDDANIKSTDIKVEEIRMKDQINDIKTI
ncbi:hypothetical protein GJ496_002309 [Pomphorhynchus laevis]|nr:hypothetical protein GJ496_002309 [Pomphorhynchus laevis]